MINHFNRTFTSIYLHQYSIIQFFQETNVRVNKNSKSNSNVRMNLYSEIKTLQSN